MSGDQYGTGYGGDYPAASGDQPGTPQPKPSDQRPLIIALGAVVLAGLVVLVLAVSGVFSGGGGEVDATTGARSAVEKVLYASKRQNLDDVKAVVCKKDLTNPELSDIVGDEHATSYSIGEATEDGPDRVTVSVTVKTSDDDTDSARLPVIREDGEWRVCFSEIGNDRTTSLSIPSPTVSPTVSPTISPVESSSSSSINICASRSDAASTARLFISYITLGRVEQLTDCVADGKLSDSQLKALLGDVYSPTQTTGSGPRFSYKSANGSSTITVTVEQQSDGRYYVTAASKT